ncbi:oligosaccharide flippase family protein [Campylobacter gastrosuis]|uniref:Oligosaccharide flippase family protein n=1 Tax=Campylobacter gastrosuis TaxID=2974576 RepID=A0ABT7HN05_9BACT|nr:oligosaccharide flippase family protein [Campylobacter gastrosuis]MDL0088302.1 oligosaccharide flippase family protein [Campylobacter gastrosuis]
MFKSEFLRNAFILIGGSSVSQMITIAISPILTRLYSPDDFAIFALYMAISSVLAIFFTGQYEAAIVLPKNDKVAINVVFLSFALSVFGFIILLIVIFVLKTEILIFFNIKQLEEWIYLIPFSVFIMSIYSILNYWNTRKKYYKNISIAKILQNSTAACLNIVIAVFSRSGLVMGQLFGQVVFCCVLAIKVIKRDERLMQYIKISTIRYVSKKYIRFPKMNILICLADSLYNDVKYIVFGLVFLPNFVGQIYIVYRVLNLPSAIIGTNMANALFQHMSALDCNTRQNNILNKIFRVWFFLMAIAFLPCLFIYFYGEVIFVFIFGEQWFLAGKIASILIFGIFFEFSIFPFFKIFYTFNKNGLYLTWEILRAFIVFIPLFLLYFFGFNDDAILYSLSFSTAISYGLLFMLLIKVARKIDN